MLDEFITLDGGSPIVEVEGARQAEQASRWSTVKNSIKDFLTMVPPVDKDALVAICDDFVDEVEVYLD